MLTNVPDYYRNVMSSQEVVDFVNERLKAEGNESKPLSAVIEEVGMIFFYCTAYSWFHIRETRSWKNIFEDKFSSGHVKVLLFF